MNNPINEGIYPYYGYIKFSLKNKVFFLDHHDYLAGPGGGQEKILNFTKPPGQPLSSAPAASASLTNPPAV